MMRHARVLTVLIALAVAAGPTAANADGVSLLGPEVYKLDWNTRSLVAHDLNGDGRVDLAVINNDRAKIDLLYQRKPGSAERPARRTRKSNRWEPVLEDSRFKKKSVVTGGSMFSLAVGDLDSDGRPDLVYTGKSEPLTVLYQGRGDDWTRRRTFEIDQPVQWTGSLGVADLQGDGRDDLFVLTKTALLIFRQEASGELAGPKSLALVDEGCYGLLARDLDGDGRLDLMYLAPQSKHAWRVRLQAPDGEFGPERSFRIDTPVTFLEPLGDGAVGVPVFASVHRRTRLLELLTLEPGADGAGTEIGLRPRVFSTKSGSGQGASYALGDFNADGRIDLAVATYRSAQVQLYLRQPDGGFESPTSYPSLPDVRSIAAGDLDGDGAAELIVLSSKEGTVGLSRLSAEGRLSYPRPVPTNGRPLAVAAGELSPGGGVRIAYLYEDEGQRGVAIVSRGADADSWDERRIELAGLRTDPSTVRILDANQDGRQDLAVFTVQSPMRLLLQDTEGGFAEATAEQGFRPGLVDKLRPSSLGMGDVDGDGKDEMLISDKGFARSLRVGASGELEVLDQFNARESGTDVSAAIAVDLDRDGVPEILLAEDGGDALQLLRRDERGVYRYRASIPVGSIDVVGTELLEDGDHTDLLILGKTRFWWIPIGQPGLRVSKLASYETDLDEMSYVDLVVGDLTGDGREEIVVVDSAESHLMEILTSDDDGAWRSALHFTIFEVDPHYQGRQGTNREPRELVISDLTSDGKPDLALLIHDRVLLYPQL